MPPKKQNVKPEGGIKLKAEQNEKCPMMSNNVGHVSEKLMVRYSRARPVVDIWGRC